MSYPTPAGRHFTSADSFPESCLVRGDPVSINNWNPKNQVGTLWIHNRPRSSWIRTTTSQGICLNLCTMPTSPIAWPHTPCRRNTTTPRPQSPQGESSASTIQMVPFTRHAVIYCLPGSYGWPLTFHNPTIIHVGHSHHNQYAPFGFLIAAMQCLRHSVTGIHAGVQSRATGLWPLRTCVARLACKRSPSFWLRWHGLPSSASQPDNQGCRPTQPRHPAGTGRPQGTKARPA